MKYWGSQQGSRMRLRLLAVVVIPDVPMLRLMKFMVLKEKFLPCSL